MYYRLTKMTFDSSRRDEFYAYADGVRDQLKALGAQSIFVVEVNEGSSFTIAAYESKEDADKAGPQVKEILGGMAQFMTAPPEASEGEVTWEM